MNAYLSEYQKNQINTAPREQILVLLYEGAIGFANQAIQAIKERNRTLKAERISKVVKIISELSGSLDWETGGEIVENLDGLYNFMMLELLAANANDDHEKISVVVKILSELKDAWQEAIKIKANDNTETLATPVQPSQTPPENYKPLKADSY